MEIAVTGYTGFIGRHLIRRLHADGHYVVLVGRYFAPTKCDLLYHLACPSTTSAITEDPCAVMDTIMDATRKALNICPAAKFVNASSVGAEYVDDTPQGGYNVAKRCMEVYLNNSGRDVINYRIPAVYGPGMHDDFFIKKCVDQKATPPNTPDQPYWIAHVDEVVDALVKLRPIEIEHTTVGEIYEQFTSGRRGLHRPASSS